MATVTVDALEMVPPRFRGVRVALDPWARLVLSEAENVAMSELPNGSAVAVGYGGGHWTCRIWSGGERLAATSEDVHDAIYQGLLAFGIVV